MSDSKSVAEHLGEILFAADEMLGRQYDIHLEPAMLQRIKAICEHAADAAKLLGWAADDLLRQTYYGTKPGASEHAPAVVADVPPWARKPTRLMTAYKAARAASDNIQRNNRTG